MPIPKSPSFNQYLQRALSSSNPNLVRAGKAVKSVTGYADRLGGFSASRLATQTSTLERANKVAPSPKIQRLLNTSKSMSDAAAAASHKTRMRTGGVVLGGLLAHQALKSYTPSQASDPYASYDYSYPSYSPY